MASRGYSGRGGGGRRDSGRGRGSGGGGGFRTTPPPAALTEAYSNLIRATVTPHFTFYKYGIEALNKDGKAIESVGRRRDIFRYGMFDPTVGLLARNGITSEKERKDLQRVLFFEGNVLLCPRPLPFVESVPFVLVGEKNGNNAGVVMPNADSMTITVQASYSVPEVLRPPGSTAASPQSAASNPSEMVMEMDRRCRNCAKSFVDAQALLAHCGETGHSPVYSSDTSDVLPASVEEFLAYANVALKQAMGERLARWGKDYIDSSSMTEPLDRNGRSLGVKVFRAFSCEFGIYKPHGQPTQLTLNVDLRAKIIRSKSLLDNIYEDSNPNTGRLSDSDKSKFRRMFESEVVICTYDKKCYSVVNLDFENSASSLMIPDIGMSHAEYFEKKKGIKLKYPNAKPIVAVLGRAGNTIHLPAELVCNNELDPVIKQSLPLIASYKPPDRHMAMEEVKRYLIPGEQKTRGVGGGLLPALGIVLSSDRVKVSVERLPLPIMKVAGVQIPKEKCGFWAPVMNQAQYKVDAGRAVQLKVVLVYNYNLKNYANEMYTRVRNAVNKMNASYRFGDTPHAKVEAGDNEKHWGAVERHFGSERSDNIFVLDLAKPPRRQANDSAYSVVKSMLSSKGYLSQFINFNTCDHSESRNEKKSFTIIVGIARQILSKCGVRVWWVNIPPQIPLPVVFVGVDVFHAPRKFSKSDGKKLRKQSVAAVIVHCIRSHQEQSNSGNVEIYSQTFVREAGQEIDLGLPIQETLTNALRALKVNPMSCIMWRDGVGMETINKVASQEIPALRRALASIVPPSVASKRPPTPLAYMIVQKRINMKFLSLDGSRSTDPGDLVLSLQGLEHATFYLSGASPPYSTPKPARFIIAQMDPGLGPKKKVLAELSWALCHDYSNWTGPIKLPSPVQHAHKLAELAGGFDDCGASINNNKFAGKIYFL